MNRLNSEEIQLKSILSHSRIDYSMERLEHVLRVRLDIDKLMTQLAQNGNILMENKIDSVEVYIGDQVFIGREEYKITQHRESKGYKHVTS